MEVLERARRSDNFTRERVQVSLGVAESGPAGEGELRWAGSKGILQNPADSGHRAHATR
jgi:hypothetical protein